jgi:hypothetical protein
MDEKRDFVNSLLDRYQLAGLDHRQRGFSRPVEFKQQEMQYRASLRYESQKLMTRPAPTQEAALLVLIHDLHEQGYRQLKTQLSFRQGAYLGSQEIWIEYPDPAPDPGLGLLAKIRHWFRRSANGSP